MTRKKNHTKDAVLLDALRANLNLLGELAVRYEVETQPERSTGERSSVCSPQDVRRVLQPEMASLAHEQLRVLLLDTRTRLVGQRVIYQGSVSAIPVRPAEVFRPAVIEAVPHIIIVHSHPSGDAEPSPEDIAVTKQLVEAGKLLGIELLDHVVIGGDETVSLKERGLMA